MARRCAAVGRFLSRNKGKVGEDGRIAIDKMAPRCAAVERFLSRNRGEKKVDGRTAIGKMARRCAAVGALVLRSVREGALKPRQRCADAREVGGRGRAICS